MKFRTDINTLRAIAVIGVLWFHFSPMTLSGGFVGVDVFFVISGYLMTDIIIKGLKDKSFSTLNFYKARFKRITPALSFMCLILIFFGVLNLPPLDLITLSNHVFASVTFLSNLIYYRESGYFDVASHDKWLLHTWSLSVEWQFYIIYPLVLSFFYKIFKEKGVKFALFIGTLSSFILSLYASYYLPNAAYYMLPTRAWQMTIGGVACVFPLVFNTTLSRYLQSVGVMIILFSYVFIDNSMVWPGYYSLLPIIGTYLVLIANVNNSYIANNFLFRNIGKWSYSIYLWHWPIVVFGYHHSYESWWIIGVPLSILCGIASYYLIECNAVKTIGRFWVLITKPFVLSALVFIVSAFVILSDGLPSRYPDAFNQVNSTFVSSPYRETCHISSYKLPSESCEYFSTNVRWATLGDSHAVELSYELAKELEKIDEGVKHFSFSGCSPSYEKMGTFSTCTKWLNESVQTILDDERIENVVIIFRYSAAFFGDNINSYPLIENYVVAERVLNMAESIDSMISILAQNKKQVFVFYPVPELGMPISKIVSKAFLENKKVDNVNGTSREYYNLRNQFIMGHFSNGSYLSNVHFLKPSAVLCNEENCFAVKNSKSMYFDANHLSIYGAQELVKLIEIIE